MQSTWKYGQRLRRSQRRPRSDPWRIRSRWRCKRPERPSFRYRMGARLGVHRANAATRRSGYDASGVWAAHGQRIGIRTVGSVRPLLTISKGKKAPSPRWVRPLRCRPPRQLKEHVMDAREHSARLPAPLRKKAFVTYRWTVFRTCGEYLRRHQAYCFDRWQACSYCQGTGSWQSRSSQNPVPDPHSLNMPWSGRHQSAGRRRLPGRQPALAGAQPARRGRAAHLALPEPRPEATHAALVWRRYPYHHIRANLWRS